MIIAKVVGTAVSTLKDKRIEGMKLLLVSKATPEGESVGVPFLAVDLVGAGEGETVFLVEGSTARVSTWTGNAPVDAAIVGILDTISSEKKMANRKKGN
jgi:microcompartment protein CcmK/EutM